MSGISCRAELKILPKYGTGVENDLQLEENFKRNNDTNSIQSEGNERVDWLEDKLGRIIYSNNNNSKNNSNIIANVY